MKHVDVVAFENATPVATKMDRKAKLLHWAALVAKHDTRLAIFHRLEYWTSDMLNDSSVIAIAGTSAFSLALADPVFRAQGLEKQTARGVMDFFELSQEQLHEFSCDCGGSLTPKQMADRIAKMAGDGGSGGAAPLGGFVNRMFRR